MIGLDTSVLVRYIAQDDETQSPKATKLIEKECTADSPGFISLITLVELVWVCESCYKATKREIISLLRKLLSAKQFQVQNAEIVWQAVLLFEKGNADFSDYLIERVCKDSGCVRTVTFDKEAAAAGMKLLA